MLRLLTIILIFTFTLNQFTFAFPLPATPVAICVYLCPSVVNNLPYVAQYGASNVASFDYTRDNLGRITHKVETVSGVTNTFDYVYDLTGRLTDVSKNGVNISHYEFDSNGNRTLATLSEGVFSATYDSQDRLLSAVIPAQAGTLPFSYTYTANGELQTKTHTITGEVTSYNYDVLGNLLSVTLPDGTLIEYLIDGQNRRIGKKINGTLVKGWLYQDSLNPIAELDGSGNIVSRFVYGSWPFSPDYMIKGGETYRIVQDHLGSPRVVINANTGTIAQELSFDEYGNVLQDTAQGFQPFGFAGGLYDPDTGLVRFGARDYDSTPGRWTAKDPTVFVSRGTNIYRYCLNDSINLVDVNGKTPVAVAGIVFVGNPLGLAVLAGLVGIIGAGIYFSQKGPRSTLPTKGCPGTSGVEDRGDGKGTIRDYGEDGTAETDYDFGHDHNGAGDPHAHDWENGKRGEARPIEEGE